MASIAAQTHSETRVQIDELISNSREIYKSTPKEALEIAARAEGLAKEISYTDAQITALCLQGESYNILSVYSSAIEKLNEALSLVPQDNLMRKAKVYRTIGSVYYNRGSYEEALEYTFRSLEIIRKNNDRLGESYCLNNIGTIYRNMDNLELALEYYFQSIDIKEELGDEKSIYNTFSNIAVVYSTLNDFKTARDFLYKAILLMRKYNDKNAEAHALNSLGLCYKYEQDYDKAYKYCIKGRDLARKIGNRQSECHAVVNIGLMYTEQEAYNEAIPHLTEGYELALEVGDKGGIANALSHLGIVYFRLGDSEKGITEIKKGFKAAEDMNHLKLMARAAKELALIYEKSEDYKNAALYWRICKECEEKHLREVIDSKTKALLLQYDVEKHRKEAEFNKVKNVELLDVVKKLDKINEEKNNFIGIISHDIRDPVSSIYSLSDFIINDIDDLSKEELLDFSKDIKHSSEKVIRLLQALLDINAIETGRYNLMPEKFDLTQVLNHLVAQFAERALAKDIVIHLDVSSKYYVFCDRNSIEQVFSNLISNAVKYSPKGKNVYINIREDKNWISASVKDEGPGFKDEDKDMLFQKFARLSAKPTDGETSTGLGLSIVKQLVEMNKGTVRCKSEYMKGAELITRLPKG